MAIKLQSLYEAINNQFDVILHTNSFYDKEVQFVDSSSPTMESISLTEQKAIDKQILEKYAFYWFLASKNNIISMGYGGGQPNISQDLIKSLRITVFLVSYLGCHTLKAPQYDHVFHIP